MVSSSKKIQQTGVEWQLFEWRCACGVTFRCFGSPLPGSRYSEQIVYKANLYQNFVSGYRFLYSPQAVAIASPARASSFTGPASVRLAVLPPDSRSPFMAQPSTTYKFELNLTDLDRGVYESVKQTIARHPSETEERMTVRLLAYAFWYNEQLSFGRGLSDVDEPALWEKSLDDRVLHWIEVGQPDADRLTWCSRRTERTSLLAYGSLRVWEGKVIPAIKNLKNVNIAAVPQDVLEVLAKDMPRVIKWDVMISEGTVFVTDDRGQHEVQLQWLAGERG
ncbi:YaeQ protein family [Pseudomonas syringae pv. rhaphiolepidis]|nr:YaeQ protein family [Pseudomonas syringae pv. rhaphiolepidis]